LVCLEAWGSISLGGELVASNLIGGHVVHVVKGRTGPGPSETVWLEPSVSGWVGLTVVVGFVFGWWGVPDGFEDPVVVEPVDPLECGVFDVIESPPRPTSMNQFSLVEAVDRFRHRVIETVADRTC